jgi:hypothetical protein
VQGFFTGSLSRQKNVFHLNRREMVG